MDFRVAVFYLGQVDLSLDDVVKADKSGNRRGGRGGGGGAMRGRGGGNRGKCINVTRACAHLHIGHAWMDAHRCVRGPAPCVVMR